MEIWMFTSNNCRMVDERFASHPDAYIDPDRSKVKGIPPHFWKPPADRMRVGGQFRPMNPDEMASREAQHRKYGVDNHIGLAPTVPQEIPSGIPWKKIAAIGAAIAALGAAATGAYVHFHAPAPQEVRR